jgi:hypothetical protein
MASSGKLRTRWAAIGAACAVTLGGGTLGIVQASVTSGNRAVYVPITPVRVLDTRSDVGVATVQDATPALLTVTGTIATTTGQQNVVPVGASSVVINVTAINPTSDGFVSLRPGDATGAPAVSTLNVTVGGTFPNGATITLPTTGGSAGQIQIWYEAYAATGGTTDLLIDVVGYYADHNHDDRYYTETEVDTALAGKATASELTSALAGKANTSDLASALAGKANTSDLANALAGKANTSDLAGKANTSDLANALAGKANIPSLLSPITSSVPVLITTNEGGEFPSIAIGINGNPIIISGCCSGLDATACNNPACTTSTNSFIATYGLRGHFTSMAIGINGNPIVSYINAWTDGGLRVAACNNPTCTTSTISNIDSASAGVSMSIAIGINGNPIISYGGDDVLKVAACNNPTCTTSTITTIEYALYGNGLYSSIVIGINGNPIISYGDNTSDDLKVAACNNPTCTTSTISNLDNNGGWYTSIAIGTNGNPIISYFDYISDDLKVAACDTPTCTTSTNTTIDSSGDVGKFSSIAIGTNGNPIISYNDSTNSALKIAVCNNPTCTTSTNTTIDSNGSVGSGDSIAIGINGNPIISYWDGNNALKVFSPWWMVGGR